MVVKLHVVSIKVFSDI